ncbi:MAG: CBS domain-containing protein [Gammaproteobacteria bacterium]
MNTALQILNKRDDRRIWSIKPDATVYEAIAEMDKRSVGALLVMDEDRLFGIISERDYTRKIVLKQKSSRTTKVSDIMTQNVYCVQKEESIDKCMRIMHEHAFRHLPILDGETVIGMLTVKDVLGILLCEKDELIHQLENYINS